MKTKALLIIDMQNDFVLSDAPQCVQGATKIIPNIQKVLYLFREKGLPIFHIIREYRANGSDVEHTRVADFLKRRYCVPNTKGSEIIAELTPVNGEYTIIKNRFSGFMQTELDFILRNLGTKELVICGIQYPNCIRATVFDGVSLGYDITLISDATGAQSERVAESNIFDMKNVGVELTTTKDYLNNAKFF